MSDNSSRDQTEVHWKGDAADFQELRQQLWPLMSIETPVKRLKHHITLVDVGTNRRQVIFALRDLAAISLGAAKQLIGSVPVDIPLPISHLRLESDIEEAMNDGVRILQSIDAKAEIPFEQEWDVFPFPADVLAPFPHLQWLPGWQMIAHTYSATGGSGESYWIMPPDAPPWREQTQMWKGERAIGSREIKEALSGDRSPQSFLEASVLIRDMTGSGPGTDGGRWYSHDLVGAPTDENWLWIQEEVFCRDDLQPNVVISRDGSATVTFFTVSRLNQVRLVRHRDCYHPGSYSPECEMLCCATGGQGYVH